MALDPPVPDPVPVLLEVLRVHAAVGAYSWLEGVLPRTAEQAASSALFGALAGAGRRCGARRPDLTEAQRAAVVGVGVAEPSVWSLADLARTVLLSRALSHLPSERHVALATEVFRKGDTGERVSLLRALSLLPDSARFVPIAVEACRSHVLDVLLAVAHHNPLPARAFSDEAWNQLVMKVLFVDERLAPLIGFGQRVAKDLVRMARDFEAERRAAGRPVPRDLPLLLATETPP